MNDRSTPFRPGLIQLLVTFVVVCVLVSCTPRPRPIEYGGDSCHFCKMTVVDSRHAAQAVTSKGKNRFFDAAECLVNHVATSGETEWAFLLVCDYGNPGQLVQVSSATFLISEAIPSPMGAYLSAFSDKSQADKIRTDRGGQLFTWDELLLHMTDTISINYAE